MQRQERGRKDRNDRDAACNNTGDSPLRTGVRKASGRKPDGNPHCGGARAVGTRYEEIAARFLSQQGYRILCRNYRSRRGEIDLIAMDGDWLVFAEVKYRTTDACGVPAEAVGWRKQKRLLQTARCYLSEHGLFETQYRFDVVEILGNRIRVLKYAFSDTAF